MCVWEWGVTTAPGSLHPDSCVPSQLSKRECTPTDGFSLGEETQMTMVKIRGKVGHEGIRWPELNGAVFKGAGNRSGEEVTLREGRVCVRSMSLIC